MEIRAKVRPVETEDIFPKVLVHKVTGCVLLQRDAASHYLVLVPGPLSELTIGEEILQNTVADIRNYVPFRGTIEITVH